MRALVDWVGVAGVVCVLMMKFAAVDSVAQTSRSTKKWEGVGERRPTSQPSQIGATNTKKQIGSVATTSTAKNHSLQPTARPLAKAPTGGRVDSVASFLQEYAKTGRFQWGQPRKIQLTPDGRTVLFLRGGSHSPVLDLYAYDLSTRKERVLLTAQSILQGAAEKLSAREKALRERLRLSAQGIVSYELSQDGKRLLVPLSGKLFVIDRTSGKVRELLSRAGYPLTPQLSPDGRYVATARQDELYVIDVSTGKEQGLTRKIHPHVLHGVAEFVAQEEMDRHRGFWWSPDSRWLVYQQTDNRPVERMFIMDPRRPYRAPQSWAYPRAGKSNAIVRLGIISVSGGATVWIQWDRKRYPYLATVRWQKFSPLTLVVQNREQTEQLVLTVDPKTGETLVLLQEQDRAWLNLDQSVPYWLDQGTSFLWSTERRGFWQLERRHADGSLAEIFAAPSSFRYRRLLAVDETTRQIFVLGHDTRDPRQGHVYTIDMRLGEARRLTMHHGSSSAIFQTKAQRFVLLQTLISGTTMYRVYSYQQRGEYGQSHLHFHPQGELVSRAKKPPFVPNVRWSRVGKLRWFAAVVRPRSWQPGRQYPVVVNIYGGPHAQMVSANKGAYLLDQWIANHGLIVVRMDGRGTPYQGRAWERSIRGNFVQIPLSDQVDALRLLAQRHPDMDLTRVGIYGWSFGGYMAAMATIRHPEIFKVGIAGAPVTDWHDYDTHYTERYLGLPQTNAEGYRQSSVLTYASQLRRPLLLIHGTADDNVYFTHSLQLSEALNRAGRRFDFLPLPGFTHMVRTPWMVERLYKRMVSYLLQHLNSSRPKEKQ